jgi:hypothetical protein
MSESTVNAIITAIGSLLGGIIGAYATIQAAKVKLLKSPNDTESKFPLLGIIIGTIIGAISTLVILAFLGFIPTPTTTTPTIATSTTTSTTPNLSSLFFESFENSSSNNPYDTNIWECTQKCDLAMFIQEQGSLKIKMNGQGGVNLGTRQKWQLENVKEVSGKFKITQTGKGNGGAWLGFGGEFSGKPLGIHCSIYPVNNLANCEVWREGVNIYGAEMVSIGDGWHVLRVEIDPDIFGFRFYVDNTSFGQYTPDNVANLGGVNLSANIGAYADTGDAQIDVFIDEVTVTGFNK